MKNRTLAFLTALFLLLTACSAPASSVASAESSSAASASVSTSSEMSSVSSAASSKAEEEKIYLGDFTAETVTGETLDQTVFRDYKLTVINVWATYCGPCKVEIPYLGKIAKERADEVQILGIVTDVIDQKGNPDADQVALALEILEQSGAEYQSLIINQSLAYLGFASLSAVPATLFVDSEGNLVGQGFYGSLSEEKWNSVIDERLGMIEE